jgi:ribonuclease-3
MISDQKLKTEALTHRSALNEKKYTVSNERLEFLGDAVLELVVSQHIFKHHPGFTEGQLSNQRAQIVQTKTLAETAKSLGLDKLLILSKGEAKSGGRENESILADCFEAVTGAIYVEGGLTKAREFIDKHLLCRHIEVSDYKSSLQEKWQKRWHLAPKYKLIKTEGPEHKKIFTVGVFLKSRLVASGQGRSKQKAEIDAARKTLEIRQ